MRTNSSRKMVIWHVITINCDCGSDILFLRKVPKWLFGPRCRGCNKVLGPMRWRAVGRVTAHDVFRAAKAWKNVTMATIRAEKAEAKPCVWDNVERKGHEWYLTGNDLLCRRCGEKVKGCPNVKG